MLKILTWTAVIAGVVALPLILWRRSSMSAMRDINIRYDVDDYVSEVNL